MNRLKTSVYNIIAHERVILVVGMMNCLQWCDGPWKTRIHEKEVLYKNRIDAII